MASAEASPFAKTGGLADVTSSLSKALDKRGHEVALILPKYLMVDRGGIKTEPIDLPLLTPISGQERTGWIHRAVLPGSNCQVYLVTNDHYYNRNGLYGENGRDYPDNLERFVFFCRAVLELMRSDEFVPDILHCHDWQAALLPAYLRSDFDSILKVAGGVRSVFTTHNIAFQGFFPRDQFETTGLSWNLFTPDGVEYYGDLNLMKSGLVYSDAVTTVSERYAAEIMTPEYGCGLESVVASVRDRLHGILNGVDYDLWNPETDSLIPANYSRDNLSGKAQCKAALQKELDLPTNPEIPLLGSIGRFDRQKGLDLIAEILEDLLLRGEVQFVILGSGDPEIERQFQRLQERFPDSLRVRIGLDEALAHGIQAGVDMFLMPSRFEPCGLAQLYSLKYGTVPIVRMTGGLADTIRDFNEAQKDGYGFVFNKAEGKELLHAVERAISVYRDKTAWEALMKRGMACDFSWDASAKRYERLYRTLLGEE